MVVPELFGQKTGHICIAFKHFAVANGIAQDVRLISGGKVGLQQTVGRIGQNAQRTHDNLHGNRGLQLKPFVRNQSHFGQMHHHIVGNERDRIVVSYQYGHVFGPCSLLQQRLYRVAYIGQHTLFAVFFVQKAHLNPTLRLLTSGHQLFHVLISYLHLLRSRWAFLLQLALFYGTCRLEKGIVKVNDVAFRAIVGRHSLNFKGMWRACKLLFNLVQQSPVARTPSVYALFHVAHNQALRLVVTHTLLQKHLKVGPLHRACILKLVNHDVFELCSYLLEDKRRVAIVYQGVQKGLRVAQQKAVRLLV